MSALVAIVTMTANMYVSQRRDMVLAQIAGTRCVVVRFDLEACEGTIGREIPFRRVWLRKAETVANYAATSLLCGSRGFFFISFLPGFSHTASLNLVLLGDKWVVTIANEILDRIELPILFLHSFFRVHPILIKHISMELLMECGSRPLFMRTQLWLVTRTMEPYLYAVMDAPENSE